MWEGGRGIPTKIIVDLDSLDESYKFWGVHGVFSNSLLSLYTEQNMDLMYIQYQFCTYLLHA